jgi:hypothetical protein
MKPKPLLWSRAEDEPIHWRGESEQSIDDLFDGMKLEMPRDKAEGLLRELLGEGAKPSYEVEAAAKEAGCSWATVRRAGDAIGVVRWRPNGDTRWWWRLPDGEPPHPDRQLAQPYRYTGEQVEQHDNNNHFDNLLTDSVCEQHDLLTPISPSVSLNGEGGGQVAQVAQPHVLRSEQLDASNLLNPATGEQVGVAGDDRFTA